jgi:hypothetical protein
MVLTKGIEMESRHSRSLKHCITFVLPSLTIFALMLGGCSISTPQQQQPAAVAEQPAPSEIAATGPAATVIHDYLAAASALDPSATKPFLSEGFTADMVSEFRANAGSGWVFSAADTRLVNEMIDAQGGKASVLAHLAFKGGSTFMETDRTFFLVLQGGAWKISGMDPLPKVAGPGVRPL